MSKEERLAKQYQVLVGMAPRRTNECWLGDLAADEGVYVCGHRILVRLEGTALDIWRVMDGKHSMADIADFLATKYDGETPDVIMDDTIACVLRLEELGLAAWRSRPLFEDVSLDG